jgi:hypothetical protein
MEKKMTNVKGDKKKEKVNKRRRQRGQNERTANTRIKSWDEEDVCTHINDEINDKSKGLKEKYEIREMVHQRKQKIECKKDTTNYNKYKNT